MASPSSLWTISPDVSFVDAFANGLILSTKGDQLALHEMVIFLPTRRACRALQDAFLRQTAGEASLLPRMIPLGEVGEDEGGTDLQWLSDTETEAEVIPPAISEAQRLLLLARLIINRNSEAGLNAISAGNGVRLARELIRLFDQVQAEGLNFEGLLNLVPEDYASHWQVTLDFLRVLTDGWPKVLGALGCLDPIARRDALIRKQITLWAKKPPRFPVFAAGSTGSVPASRELLKAITTFGSGGVVLPGLDSSLGPEEVQALEPTHPQFGMADFVRSLDFSPKDVPFWEHEVKSGVNPARSRLIAASMVTPSGGMPGPFKERAEALDKVRLVECSGQAQEAGVIALALREVLETPGKTGALITPDRSLARRVAVELNRWNIKIDDSAGRPLSQTSAGLFLRLSASVFAENCAPLPLLSLLKHPFSAGGLAPGLFRARVRELELAALRGPRPAPGLYGIANSLSLTKKPRALIDWFGRFSRLARSFERIMGSVTPVPLETIVMEHLNFIEGLAATDKGSGADRLWSGEAGEAAAHFIYSMAAGQGVNSIMPTEYPDFIDAFLVGHVVRPGYGTHPRLNIWGLLEARLQNADLVCLGGLNEGSWPSDPSPDPWMSRQIREAFGLPSHDRRIGLSAHDFAQAFCAKEVLLTRSQKVDGSPTVPSRWLLMIDTCLRAGGGSLQQVSDFKTIPRGIDLSSWQSGLDRPSRIAPVSAPAPAPPVKYRPRQLSVTAIETWRRDPYSIFARHILGLRPLEPIDADPGASDRGNIIHKALDKFVRETKDGFQGDPTGQLLSIGEEIFGYHLDRPGVREFWWPHFVKIAEWFVLNEISVRGLRHKIWTEVDGRIEIDGPAGKFALTAKADRIELLPDGTLAIIDYKTGSKPSSHAILQGYSPQLTLEALIARKGGFKNIRKAPVTALEFWKLSGGRSLVTREPVLGNIFEISEAARRGLEDLISCFDDKGTPYLSRPDPRWASPFSEYDHLARLAEWADNNG
ncbi:MAG: double-strand break repair protein AddB [Rhodospirillaceae bacterium]